MTRIALIFTDFKSVFICVICVSLRFKLTSPIQFHVFGLRFSQQIPPFGTHDNFGKLLQIWAGRN